MTSDEDEDEDDYDDEDEPTWQPQRSVQVLVAGYVCIDHVAHGHQDRYSDNAYSQPEKKRAADMTDDEREAAKAERRHVIESNKAWKAATTVRRDWLTAFAQRKTAPAGAESYLARVITEGWGHERADTDALTLAGFTGDQDAQSWDRAHHQRQAVTDALATATPKRALQIGLALPSPCGKSAPSRRPGAARPVRTS